MVQNQTNLARYMTIIVADHCLVTIVTSIN